MNEEMNEWLWEDGEIFLNKWMNKMKVWIKQIHYWMTVWTDKSKKNIHDQIIEQMDAWMTNEWMNKLMNKQEVNE